MTPEELLTERANAFLAEVYRRAKPLDDAPEQVHTARPVLCDGCGDRMRDAAPDAFKRWGAFGAPPVNPWTLVIVCPFCQETEQGREQAEAAAVAEFLRRVEVNVPEVDPGA